jgi:hypothetical protein
MEELEIHLKQRIYRMGSNISCIYLWYHFMYSYCIYFVYGEALDNKIPLLRALSADEAATDVCKYFDKM